MSEPLALDDASARAGIAERLDETLFVEAGAGTGKTTALVGRVVELVRQGRAALGKIAAITFTEAAAADLRSRLHLELTRAARQPDGGWARSALGDLDDASMTTIHGFAQRILAEHPLAAGLPLRFRVIDEIEYDLARENRFRDLIDGLVGDDIRGQLLAAARAVWISIATLSELAGEVDAKWDRFVEVARNGFSIASLTAEVDEAERELSAAIEAVLPFRSECLERDDGLVVQLDKLADAFVLRGACEDWVDRLAWCHSLEKIIPSRGQKASWTGRPIAEVREAMGELEERRAAIVERIFGRVLRELVIVFAEEAIEAANARRRAGELGFHDLLVFVHQMLRSHPDVRRQVSERYAHILVDEFQDTDPLQLKIVTDLASDASGDLVPGMLFFVGDPRQSIYRFRGAEPELYKRALEGLVPSGPLVLTSNFRSVPPILRFVNAVFERIEGNGEDRRRYHALSTVRDDGVAGTVQVVGSEPEERLSAHDRRVREAGDLATLVARCVDEGWSVEDDGTSRPAHYGDIAILVTKRSGLAELEKALDDRDIPFRADSPSLILRSAEVRDFLACLRAIDAPGDDAALISALRSPLLACGDDDLWRFRRNGGRWNLENARIDAAEPVGRALSRLRSLADRRHELGLIGTLHAVAAELEVFEIAATTRHGEESLRRLLYLFARASAYVEAGGTSVAAFVDWIDQQAGARVRGIEAAISEKDGAVRILTVHAAKGLEFPVVLLAELASDPARQRAAGLILFDDDGRFEVRIKQGVETPGYAALYEDEVRRADDELVRLLYVAMTRARDHLVVSLHRTEPGAKTRLSLADQLGELLVDLEGTYVNAEVSGGAPPQRATSGAVPPGPASTKASFAKWRDARALLCRTASLPVSVSAGSLESDAVQTPDGSSLTDDAQAPPDSDCWRSPRGATAIGRAVHGVLQRVDLHDGSGLADLVVSESVRAGCADSYEKVGALARAALASEELRRAAAAERHWRELPVSVLLGDGILDGVLDLAYEQEGRLVVVDYKTDALKDEDALRRRFTTYVPQAGAYAYALQCVFGGRVERFTFLFLNAPGGVRALDVDDLDSAIAQATEVAERYLRTPVR